ncbi:3'-5' exonuclease (plasmid) [Klebsiella pneumoniae]|uniref:3'-5' exonuclease n=1 Tax=Klebsiella pneumoniae TaxID=573 RepID=UPI001A8C8F39|nr:3'-5' exonuclease [Klebsiella pneumoniae]QSS16737.1 3'-5' exonuclease [Klebsiella pneumoniae]
MSYDDAVRISNVYRNKGRETLITRSDDLDGTYYVFVYLPESRKVPTPSRTFNKKYGNKMLTYHQSIFKMIMANWLNSDHVIIDTETTGLMASDEIIEITIINMRGEILLKHPGEARAALFRQKLPKINNITNEMVADAPAWCDVFPAALKIIRKHKWLAWNSSFDARLMVQTCLQTGFFDDLKPHLITSIIMAIETRHIDAKAVYDQWYGEFDEKRKNFKRQSLATAAARHGISTAGAHRALADLPDILGVLKQVCQPEVA